MIPGFTTGINLGILQLNGRGEYWDISLERDEIYSALVAECRKDPSQRVAAASPHVIQQRLLHVELESGLLKDGPMKRARFTEEQIIAVLREPESGTKTADLARKHGVSEATLYNWKACYGGMDVSNLSWIQLRQFGACACQKTPEMLDFLGAQPVCGAKVLGLREWKKSCIRHEDRDSLATLRCSSSGPAVNKIAVNRRFSTFLNTRILSTTGEDLWCLKTQ